MEVLKEMSSTRITNSTLIADPPLARFLFSDTRMAPVWLLVRIYVGWAWLDAGLHKIQNVGATTNYIYDGDDNLAFLNQNPTTPHAPCNPVITYKIAGHIGLDRFFMTRFGAPWKVPPTEKPVSPTPTLVPSTA